ncbi:hypothetical protein BB12_07970 [Salmonella enterica subsp. diarizonae]|uniref:Phage tail protein n=1 Tax=Salmonella enterica TaxID=28901 RepID=A0A505CV70_SALER|nr:hypothetical protein [Salmonella enterica]EBR3875194.1 hypothetical protein [Salmonella enterica subsp. arizonae]EDX3148388.1 hypothetical protein [Salmonella enterica subsp. diarizonae serovar 61:l,v:1,5,7]EII7446408.1 hypothetical protein [Salmonella enterica subsp. enterica serovar Newport]EKN5804247.1 hypothetical protein [Salmonella enterica subsp. enterica]WGI51395.1 hypothetical protein QBX66_08445 [Salmonella enterica subsp. diarizonae serovar 48:i:z]
MIITGKSLSLPGVMPTEQQGNRSDGGLTTVKTDGITITGDGNTTPLSLGPGVIDGVGGYVMAYCPGNGQGHDSYGQTISGSSLVPTSYATGGYQGRTYVTASYTRSLPGTWRLCCEAITTLGSVGLYQRIA